MGVGTKAGERARAEAKTPRIGFVVDWLKDSYQVEVLQGAARAAKEKGAQLVVLPGGVVGADHDHGIRRNELFKLISSRQYDGLVVMTGTLGNVEGPDAMARVTKDIPAARVCHIAIEVEGSPSVLIDNVGGMRRMIEHLIVWHRARRIVFIRGPESNEEAEARFHAYRDALEEHEIELDEALVLPGDFLRRAGTAAVATLFDERKLTVDDIDAIVAADDLMALAAMEELRRRGIRVPSDIAVVGFDDVDEAHYAAPPLSSVRQPLGRQGRVGVETVLRGMDGEGQPRPEKLETLCQYRRSCGCTAEDPGGLTMRPPSDTRMTLKDSVVRRRKLITDELEGATEGMLPDLPGSWEIALLDSILATLDGREEAFREAFDELLERILDHGGDASAGHALVSALRRQLSVCAGDDPGQIRRIEGLLHEARILTSNAVGRSEAQRRIRLEREAAILSEVSAQLTAISRKSWTSTMARELPRLGIENCALLALKGDMLEPVLTLAGGAMTSGATRKAIPVSDLDPSSVLFGHDDANLLVHPLDDGEKCTGFAVLVLEELATHQFEIVRDLLSAALTKRRAF